MLNIFSFIFHYVLYFLGIIYSDPLSNWYSNWSFAPSNDRRVPRPMDTFLSLPNLSFLLHAIQMTTSSFLRKWQWNHSLNVSSHFLDCFLSFFSSIYFFSWLLMLGFLRTNSSLSYIVSPWVIWLNLMIPNIIYICELSIHISCTSFSSNF